MHMYFIYKRNPLLFTKETYKKRKFPQVHNYNHHLISNLVLYNLKISARYKFMSCQIFTADSITFKTDISARYNIKASWFFLRRLYFQDCAAKLFEKQILPAQNVIQVHQT
jgi:hypothetical protein